MKRNGKGKGKRKGEEQGKGREDGGEGKEKGEGKRRDGRTWGNQSHILNLGSYGRENSILLSKPVWNLAILLQLQYGKRIR